MKQMPKGYTEYSRLSFNEIARERLAVALRCYTCTVIARKISKPDDWSSDVLAIMSEIHEMMNKEKTRTRFKDREKVLSESITEAAISQDKVLEAKDIMTSLYIKHWKKITKMPLVSEALMKDMVAKYLPEYVVDFDKWKTKVEIIKLFPTYNMEEG
jgi:hypothetical protein